MVFYRHYLYAFLFLQGEVVDLAVIKLRDHVPLLQGNEQHTVPIEVVLSTYVRNSHKRRTFCLGFPARLPVFPSDLHSPIPFRSGFQSIAQTHPEYTDPPWYDAHSPGENGEGTLWTTNNGKAKLQGWGDKARL